MRNKVKLILFAISALLAISGALFVNSAYSKYIDVKNQRDKYKNNQIAYEEIINSKEKENRVLRLNADDLRHSNDKLVNYIDSVAKSRKLPVNKPGGISAGVVTTIHDTTEVEINNPDSFKLNTVVYFNKDTKVGTKIEKSSLINTIDVNNIMTLHVYPRREFVNTYKNGWTRFWNFDWKKEDVTRYDLQNSNEIIKITDSRVILHE